MHAVRLRHNGRLTVELRRDASNKTGRMAVATAAVTSERAFNFALSLPGPRPAVLYIPSPAIIVHHRPPEAQPLSEFHAERMGASARLASASQQARAPGEHRPPELHGRGSAPRPAVRWYKDGRALNITGPIKLMRSSKTQLIELVISGATSKDAGTYQCFADNGYSVASAWAQLNVTGGDTAEPVAVRCAPVGVRSVRVHWQHKDPINVVAYTVHYSPRASELLRQTLSKHKSTIRSTGHQNYLAKSFRDKLPEDATCNKNHGRNYKHAKTIKMDLENQRQEIATQEKYYRAGTKIKIIKQKRALKDTNYYIKEDYPKYVLEKRKELQEQLKREREKGVRAKIIYDKLIIPKNNTKRKFPTSPENVIKTNMDKNSRVNKKNKIQQIEEPIKRSSSFSEGVIKKGILNYVVKKPTIQNGGVELTGPPNEEMAQNLTVQMPLVPYSFKVRAYRTDSASDLSDPVECQGQGVDTYIPTSFAVPVDVRRKGGRVKVSWVQFAKQTTAAQWVLQVRKPTNDIVNVTLPANTTTYELDVPAGEKWSVRLLGSKDLDWLVQDLTLVPWTSIPEADYNNNRAEIRAPCIRMDVMLLMRLGWVAVWTYTEPSTTTYTEESLTGASYGACDVWHLYHDSSLWWRKHHCFLLDGGVSLAVDLTNKFGATQCEMEGICCNMICKIKKSAGESVQPTCNTAPSVPEVVRVWPRGALIVWRYAEENMIGHHVYTICVRTSGRLDENCQQTSNNSATIEDLQPNTEYEIRVQAMTMGSGGAFSQPFLIVTPSEGDYLFARAEAPAEANKTTFADPQRFSEVHYTPVNASSVRVWWRAAGAELGPQLYTVRYSPKLTLPVQEWSALNVSTNDALKKVILLYQLGGFLLRISLQVPLGDNQRMYVIVMAYEPAEYSLVLTITRPTTGRATGPKSLKNIKYDYTDDGLSIRWSDSSGAPADKMYSVRYSHNITMPIESWAERNVSRAQLYNYHVSGHVDTIPRPSYTRGGEVTNVPDGAWTYVVVSPLGDARETHMLNVPPPPTRMHRAMLLGVSMGVVICAVCAGAGALCMWRRRRKRHRTTHRRATSTNDSIEDGSEMKRQGMGSGDGGAGAANGGARGAGEPLLNGHVRITENPALSKTPNGKLKKQRRPNFDAFDFSRRDMEEPHTPPLATLMDTSRPPEPYGKLPDDNMNSELGDSPTPTLQPNGLTYSHGMYIKEARGSCGQRGHIQKELLVETERCYDATRIPNKP
ncbi:Muscle M-line assembly protein unc-89 [Eumeta japonica]|uniref:Muscle M-line assembly protein unc-89 n=1 Tax=Eumeta variegata TaxID=151549 RepID=A0A4C1Y2M0_EUMVA|nr:Muscle M-line assembly protein unc-89 [Eumeta japonica]